MIQVAPTQLFTDALIGMLRADVGDGIRIYDGTTYGDVSWPYAIVTPLGGPAPDGPPLQGDGEDVCMQVQIDAVGRRRDQAQGLADRLRARLLAGALAVDGWRCAHRETQASPGCLPEGQPGLEVWTAIGRYELYWTPV
ncbi:DUF3168 domain-containing protein [Frankia sp. AvcI1]|uniref:DUF3168 domain-containing protein n=1 Tax=Frankia sp. AvcI1 TaxID=573496 RepID=UPI00211860C3|nr:DUF3168 domain-containing protein [Frankia sp. AvcI1]